MGVGLVNIFFAAAMLFMVPESDDMTEEEDEKVKVQMHGKHKDKYVLVSKQDLKRVEKYQWGMWGSYPHGKVQGTLHHLIIGSRPSNVPEDWVVDHINGDKLDASRSNLRWVSPRFNAWNKHVPGSTKYRGVRWLDGKCYAKSLGQPLGRFATEKSAGIAVAKKAIEEFGEWAMKSNVLLENFTSYELACMKEEVDASRRSKKPEEEKLPTGVSFDGKKYVVRCCGVHVGRFLDKEEAINVLTKYKKDKLRSEWEKHLQLEITRDASDNSAVIALTGKRQGVAKVPEEFWHDLTFKSSWCLNKRGYAFGSRKGVSLTLHGVVWSLLHPGYKPVRGLSIDHVNPALLLDNRAHNLRLATRSDQERNKKGRGSTSKFRGIHLNKYGTFTGQVNVNGKVRTVTRKLETDSAKALNALRVRHLGANTPLVVIE